jgi:pimeloyl-ACP methyl ester carboxylesterase
MLRCQRSWIVAVAVILTVPFTALCGTQTDASADVTGIWLHRYVDHLHSETMVFTFAKQPNGSLVATIDFPERRNQQKFSSVVVEGGKVRIKEYGIQTVFEAQLSADGSSLDGKVLMGAWRPITLKRVHQRVRFPRPQEPTRPYPYDEEEVTFRNDQAKVTLAGTLTRPRGNGALPPAVVLMSGSGPDDRDALTAGHKPFLVLADYLTRRGIAVLRFDDRGVGKSTGVFSQATTEDLAGDAQAAVEFLKERKDIDPQRIGLIGHSDGGTGAALLASRMPDVAFVVLLGAPGVPGEKLIVRQTELGLKALGVKEHQVEWQVGVQKQVAELMKREPDAAKAGTALKQLVADVNAKLTDEDRQRMGVDKAFKINMVVGSPAWLRYFVTNDPWPTLAKVRCPVLALNGDKDLIVWSRDSLPEIERALKEGGNPDYTVKELPGLNHFFQTCKVGAPFEYVLIPETIAPAALETVGDWIAKRAGVGQ